MAVFNWTYASWDKLRPTLLASTGLGKALKEYEKEKAEIEKMKIDDFIDPYAASVKALEKADKARKEAIEACGKNPLFKSAKKSLEDAKAEAEEAILKNLVYLTLTDNYEKISKPILGEVSEYKVQLERAKETKRRLEEASKKINDNMEFEEASLMMTQALSKDQLSLAESAADGENNFQPGQKSTDQSRTAMAIRSKASVLKMIAPKAMPKWEQLFALLDKYKEMQGEYQVTSREIGSMFKPYSVK